MDYFDMLRDMGTPVTLALADVVTAADPDATHHTAWERHLHALAAPTAASRPAEPTDVVDALLRYRDPHGRWLTPQHIAAMTLHLLGAGSDTTTGLIAHSLERGLGDAARWQQLADPRQAAAHVEECLRLYPPIAGWMRNTRAEVTLDGITIPADARCLVLTGTANHDPQDPSLTDRLAFGAGWHDYVGTRLARLEAAALLNRLATRLPQLRLADGYRHRNDPLRRQATRT
jgi:cytochrome P450